MKRQLGALVLAMLTLTACAELRSALEGVDSWVRAQTQGESPVASPTASQTASSAVPSAVPSAAKKKSNRILAKPPRRKPDSSRRRLAKPMRKPAPKTAVAKAAVPNVAVPQAAVPKAAVPKVAVPKAAVPKAAVASTLSLNPKLLLGLDFKSTKAILGDPEMEFEQPPAKVWTYRGGTCMFSVFFYPNLDDSVFRVLTYKATSENQATNSKDSESKSNAGSSKDGAKKLARRCFAELLIHQAAHSEG